MLSRNVCVVIPTFNEQETISGVLDSVKKYAQNIIVIDGNSSDQTQNIVKKYGVSLVLQKTRGKGAALRQAIAESSSDVLVFIDADGSHEPADIPSLVAPILDDKADMVVASRLLGGSDELHGTWDNLIRMTGSGLITLGINYRWKVHLTDVENGFRAIRTKTAQSLKLISDDFTIEQEMVMKAAKQGCRLAEIASHEYKRKGGESKLPTRQGWRFLSHFFRDIW